MKLHEIAHARTGDKGDTSNISVIAYDPAHWLLIRDWMTADRVAAHFETFDERNIERFELPQLQALNFVIRGALSGGVTRSLAQDAHGKCLASALLEMQVGYED